MKPQAPSPVLVLAGLFALVVHSLPGAAAPCTCNDIPAFQARIKEVSAHLEAYRKLLADCYANDAPADFAQAKQRFDKYAFGGARPSNVITAGSVTLGGTQVSPEFQRAYCDTIVTAVLDVHESEHNKYKWIHALPMLMGVAFGHPYMALIRNYALSEVEAHEVEKAYLEQALRKLEHECNAPWKCRCTQNTYPTATACAASCPHASLACVAPTCLQIDPSTGKGTGKGI